MATDELSVRRKKEEPAGRRSLAPDGAAELGRTSRLPSLTGLRFPAALLVFVFHSALPYPEVRFLQSDASANNYYRGVAQTGGLGVTFFFVLSGFVLTWSARSSDTARAFWRRRYVKIVPNYVVAWALAMVLIAGTTTAAWRAALNLFMLQVWIPDFPTNFSVNPPGWSLAAEAVFYLAFPLLYLGARRIAPGHLKYWTAGTFAAILATPLVAYTLVPAGSALMANEPSTHAQQYWFAYVLPLPRLLDFALGILVARAVLLGRWRNIGMIWSGVLLVGSYVLASNVPLLYGQRAVCVLPAALLIAAAATADDTGRFTLFRNRAMTWLGEISFAFYLLHYIVIAYTRKLLGDEGFSAPATVGILVADVLVTVLASWALYAWVERPITRRWSKAARSRRQDAVAAGPAPGSAPPL